MKKYTWRHTPYIIGLVLFVIALMWNRDVSAATRIRAYWSGEYTHVVSWQYQETDTRAYVFKRNALYQGETFMGETTGTQFTFSSTDHRLSPRTGDEYSVREYRQDSQGFWWPIHSSAWIPLENQRPNPKRTILPIVVR